MPETVVDPPPEGATLYLQCGSSKPGTVTLRGLIIRVVEANRRGISRIEVEMPRPLEDGATWFVTWHAGALRRVHMPPVGGSMILG